MKLTQDDVQDILELLDASSFDELSLQTEQFRLSLRRTGSGDWTQATETLSAPRLLKLSTDAPAAETGTTAADTATAPRNTSGGAVGFIEVYAPLPGTFYRSPQPGAPPFVEVGSHVEEDTVVGIVETMKLMNSIPAGTTGVVAEICAGNAQAVEKNTVLMRVKAEIGS
jgi:acetyl-CoA carboxylase biotin carboxyl carrier protein